MLTFALLLALVSTTFETLIAVRSRSLRNLAGRRLTVNLAISLGMSVALGLLFGAVGLIALMAGLLSTLMSIPVYRFLAWNFDSPEARRLGGNRAAAEWRDTLAGVRRRWNRTRHMIAKSVRLIALPVRFGRQVVLIWRAWKLHRRR